MLILLSCNAQLHTQTQAHVHFPVSAFKGPNLPNLLTMMIVVAWRLCHIGVVADSWIIVTGLLSQFDIISLLHLRFQDVAEEPFRFPPFSLTVRELGLVPRSVISVSKLLGSCQCCSYAVVAHILVLCGRTQEPLMLRTTQVGTLYSSELYRQLPLQFML